MYNCSAPSFSLISHRLADEWAKGTCYYNICGPTEVTILNTAHRHVSGTPLSIGRPLPNTTCYILDDENQLVPFGHKGVMWVGGAGVSCGYINLPKLTSQRYQRDDFANDGFVPQSKRPTLADGVQIDNVLYRRYSSLERRRLSRDFWSDG